MKVFRYHSTIGSPASRATTPPRARKGPNGIARLRAATPLTGDYREADRRAGEQGDDQRRRDVPPQEQADHCRQLDVAKAHAVRVGEGRDEEGPAGRRGGDRPLGDARGIGRDDQHRPDHGAGDEDLVRDDPLVEVGQGDGDQNRDEDEADRDLAGVVP